MNVVGYGAVRGQGGRLAEKMLEFGQEGGEVRGWWLIINDEGEGVRRGVYRANVEENGDGLGLQHML